MSLDSMAIFITALSESSLYDLVEEIFSLVPLHADHFLYAHHAGEDNLYTIFSKRFVNGKMHVASHINTFDDISEMTEDRYVRLLFCFEFRHGDSPQKWNHVV